MTRLSKTEKDEIAKLYKCGRAADEQELQDKLNKELNKITASIDDNIKDLEVKIEEAKQVREQIIEKVGYGKIDRYGCMKAHPELDAFRAHTNAQLMKLWSGEVSTL